MLECRDKPTPDMFGELLRNASNMGDLRNCPVRPHTLFTQHILLLHSTMGIFKWEALCVMITVRASDIWSVKVNPLPETKLIHNPNLDSALWTTCLFLSPITCTASLSAQPLALLRATILGERKTGDLEDVCLMLNYWIDSLKFVHAQLQSAEIIAHTGADVEERRLHNETCGSLSCLLFQSAWGAADFNNTGW